MTPRQRVLHAISRRGRGEYPIQLDVTDRALQQLGAHWGFDPSPASRFTVLHNHLVFAKPDSHQTGDDGGAGNAHTDAWNVKWASDQEGVWVRDHPVALCEDLRSYRAPEVCSRMQWESVAGAVRRYSGEFCVVGYQNALLFERAWSLRGFERLLFDMADDLAGVEAFLDVITDAQIRVAQRFVAFGIDVVRTGDDWGGQQGMLFAPGLWRQLIRPRLQAVWRIYQAHNIPIIHHSCGDIRPVLDDLVELGLDVLNPVQPEAMPLERIARRYGPHLSLYGGISEQQVLSFGSPTDVKAEVQRCVELLGKHGGYIIAPSQAVLSDVPVENVRALLDAMLTYCASKG